MRSLPILVIALMIAVLVPHVCAENVTYSQEYYDMTARADSIMDRVHNNGDNWLMMSYNDIYSVSPYRLVAIQIALEKQNELIHEQNTLLKNLTTMRYYCAMDNPGSYRPYICSPI